MVKGQIKVTSAAHSILLPRGQECAKSLNKTGPHSGEHATAPETILPNVDVSPYAVDGLRPEHQLNKRQPLT